LLYGVFCCFSFLALAYPVLILLLPQYGGTGEPLGINYTGAFVACLVGLFFAYLLLFFLFIRACTFCGAFRRMHMTLPRKSLPSDAANREQSCD
jgi:hypothetical protein